MTKPPKLRKTGKPKALEQQEEPKIPTLEEHIKEIHGQADVPQNGLPPLDWIKAQFQTKSAAIRYLVNQGFETKLIAKHLGVRYQMVRNVKVNPLKRGPNESWLPKNDPPKDNGTT